MEQEYWKLRESVGVTEFFLLRIINFHVFVDSPYGWAMHICRMLFEGGKCVYRLKKEYISLSRNTHLHI